MGGTSGPAGSKSRFKKKRKKPDKKEDVPDHVRMILAEIAKVDRGEYTGRSTPEFYRSMQARIMPEEYAHLIPDVPAAAPTREELFRKKNRSVLAQIQKLDDAVDRHLQMAAAMRNLGDREAEIVHISQAFAAAEKPDRLRESIGQPTIGILREYGFQ